MTSTPEIARSLVSQGRASLEQMAEMGQTMVFEAKSAPDSRQYRMAAHDVLLRKDADETRTVSFIASDETVDRMGDIIRVKGWELRNYRKNPIILWQHNADQPIGTGSAKKGQTAGGTSALLVDITFAKAAAHPFAEQVFQLVKDKVLRANSVGFLPMQTTRPENDEERAALGLGPYGVVFEKAELFENSVVSVPANPSAVALAMGDMVQRSVLTQEQADLFLHDGLGAQPAEWFDTTRRSVHAIGDLGSQLRVAYEDADLGEDAEDLAALEEWAKSKGDMPQFRTMGGAVTREFDIEGQHIEAARLEHDWVSRWCSCEVKRLHNISTFVTHLDAGSFLPGLNDVGMAKYVTHDTRSLTRDGLEVPPSFDTVQLTEELAGDFLANGIHFIRSEGPDAVALAVKIQRTWGGYTCSVWSHIDRADEASKVLSRSWAWAEENHYRRGAAFTLSGEFISKSDDAWPDVFLDPENRKVVQTAIGNINAKGAKAANRGMIWQGPPGTGKTLTARVLRNEADATLIWCSTRDFMYSGGAEGIMRAFDLARRFAPAVIVLEDVERWLGNYVTDLLKTEMDGLARSTGVTTILTTNHPESLPKALIDRPGRFHDVLTFDLPGEGVRTAMFAKWLVELDAATTVDAVHESDGMSGAHVYELCAFAKSVAEQDNIPIHLAMRRAIEKLKRQREQIGEHQKAIGREGERNAAFSSLMLDSTGALLERGFPQTHTLGYVQTSATTNDTQIVPWQTLQLPAVGSTDVQTADALRGVITAQTEQTLATRQLVDVLSDLARKVLTLNGDAAVTPAPGDGGSGDEEIDPETLRSVSDALARLADTAARK